MSNETRPNGGQHPQPETKPEETKESGQGGNAEPKAGNENGTPPKTPEQEVVGALTQAVVKLIGALATTAGFVTFVALTGQAIVYARFWGAELPADQAVQLVPENDLVILGAVALTIFITLGVVAVAGVYAIDSFGQAKDEMRPGLVLLITLEILIAILFASGGEKIAMGAFALAVGFVAVLITLQPIRQRERETANEQHDSAEEGSGSGMAHLEKVLPGDRTLPRLLKESPTPTKEPAHVLTVWGIGAVAAAAIGVGGIFAVGFDELIVGASVVLAVLLAVICLGVARASGTKFWPYGLAIFFSVVLFGAVVNIARIIDLPRANPVALIRAGADGNAGVVGILVARRDDRYWLGAVTLKCEKKDDKMVPSDHAVDGSGRIFSIPRTQVLDDEIGAAVGLRDVEERSRVLLEELKKRQPPGGSPPPSENASTSTSSVPTTEVASAPVPAVDAECTCATPTLAGVTPSPAKPGEAITLEGSNLEDVTEVVVGSAPPAKVTTATKTSVAFVGPKQAGTKLVRVRSCGESNDINVITAEPPKPPSRIVRLRSSDYFEINKSDLSVTGRHRLTRLKRQLERRKGKIASIQIDGYADYTGSTSHNQQLSASRGAAVQTFFEKTLTLPRGTVEVTPHGEDDAEAHTFDDPNRAIDRRVDVVVTIRFGK